MKLKKRKFPGQLNISGVPEPLLRDITVFSKTVAKRSRSAEFVEFFENPKEYRKFIRWQKAENHAIK